MSVVRVGAVLLLALSFGVLLSRVVSLGVDPMETRSTMNLCDSGGRRPCP
jgi:hypothetical protein